MNCLCGDENCRFTFNQKLIRPKILATLHEKLKFEDILHILMGGVRILNLDLTIGTDAQNEELIQQIHKATDLFYKNSEFNVPITKVCTIRGKLLIAGRMRNDCCFYMNKCELITLTNDNRYAKCCSNDVCFISNFSTCIRKLKLNDIMGLGSIELQVVKILDESFVTCFVVTPGELKSYEKLVWDHFEQDEQAHDQEIQDCKFVVANKFDYVIVPDVKLPEYFHFLENLLKCCDAKLIARIEKDVKLENIQKIYDHFQGIFINHSTISIEDVTRMGRKPIIVDFPKGNAVNRKAIQTCELCDCLELKINSLVNLTNAIRKLTKISNGIEKYAKYNQDDTDEHANPITSSTENQVKAIISITKSGMTVQDMKDTCLIAITEEESLARKLQLHRNTVPMIFVDCESKGYKEQVEEMKNIGMKFLLSHKVISDDEMISVKYLIN